MRIFTDVLDRTIPDYNLSKVWARSCNSWQEIQTLLKKTKKISFHHDNNWLFVKRPNSADSSHSRPYSQSDSICIVRMAKNDRIYPDSVPNRRKKQQHKYGGLFQLWYSIVVLKVTDCSIFRYFENFPASQHKQFSKWEWQKIETTNHIWPRCHDWCIGGILIGWLVYTLNKLIYDWLFQGYSWQDMK